MNNSMMALLGMFPKVGAAILREGEGETGGDTVALAGDDTVALGDDTVALGDDTVALGDDTVVLGGDDTVAAGDENLTDEQKAEAAAEAKLNSVPEDNAYEFDLPEGVELPDEARTMWAKEFGEMGLTQKQAQQLVARQAEQLAAEQKAHETRLSDMQKDHLTAAKSDKDIGGDKWTETVSMANNVLTMLRGGPKAGVNADGSEKMFDGADGAKQAGKPEGALESLILTSGNGNNPEVLRELRRLGQHFADDVFAKGATHEEPRSKQSSWYSDTTPKSKKG